MWKTRLAGVFLLLLLGLAQRAATQSAGASGGAHPMVGCTGTRPTCTSPCFTAVICDSDSHTWQCSNNPYGTSCTDGKACTVHGACDGEGHCVVTYADAGTSCDAGFPCFAGACIASGDCRLDAGGAHYLDAGVSCNDGKSCTSEDQCDGMGNCTGAFTTPLNQGWIGAIPR